MTGAAPWKQEKEYNAGPAAGRAKAGQPFRGEPIERLAAKLSKTLLFVLSGRLCGARSKDCLLSLVADCRLLPSFCSTVHKVNFATEIMLKRYMVAKNFGIACARV